MPLLARLPEGLDVAQGTCPNFVLSGIFSARADQGSPPESFSGLIPLAIYSIPQGDHDSFFNLPPWCREARRSITSAMDLRPPRSAPGYLACEPAVPRPAAGGAANTAAPPIAALWPLSPRWHRAETSSVDTCVATGDRAAPRSAPLPPAASAAF